MVNTTPSDGQQDEGFMRLAIREAIDAAALGEVPVGAVLVSATGEILARAGNRSIVDQDPAGHAELLALRAGAARLGNHRLTGATLYATLEPCPMCAGAMVHARIARLVFGAADPKGGGVISKYRIGRDGLLNHCFTTEGGILTEECAALLRDFFRNRRR